MKADRPHPAESALLEGNSQVNIEAIVEQIWADLGGATTRADIREVLLEVAPSYENARVKTYVPILLRKEAFRRLRDGLAYYEEVKTPEPKNGASGKAADSATKDRAESTTKYTRPELNPARTS